MEEYKKKIEECLSLLKESKYHALEIVLIEIEENIISDFEEKVDEIKEEYKEELTEEIEEEFKECVKDAIDNM